MWVAALILIGVLGIVVAITLGIIHYKRKKAKIREESRMPQSPRLTAFRISDRIREGTKYCRYCGKPNRDDAQFCTSCGKPISVN